MDEYIKMHADKLDSFDETILFTSVDNDEEYHGDDMEEESSDA